MATMMAGAVTKRPDRTENSVNTAPSRKDPSTHSCENRHGELNMMKLSQNTILSDTRPGSMMSVADANLRSTQYIDQSGMINKAKVGFMSIPTAISVPANAGFLPLSAKL